jgi:hypothetical protein
MVGSQFILFLNRVVFGLAELIISLRIVLKLLGASTTSTFVLWIYDTSRPLLAPFEGMFPTQNLSGGLVVEFSALFALVIYALASYLIEELIGFIDKVTESAKK